MFLWIPGDSIEMDSLQTLVHCRKLVNWISSSSFWPLTLIWYLGDRNLNDKPIYVSAGENHTAVLTSERESICFHLTGYMIDKLKLYMSGSNSFGQLGIEEVVNTLKPTILPVILKEFQLTWLFIEFEPFGDHLGDLRCRFHICFNLYLMILMNEKILIFWKQEEKFTVGDPISRVSLVMEILRIDLFQLLFLH